MPTYEYKCSSCGHEWEEEQRIVEDPLDTCPACSQKTAQRQISGGNFILKGGGWYADLYSSPSKRGNNGGSSKSSSSTTSTTASDSSSSPSSTSTAPSAAPATPAKSS